MLHKEECQCGSSAVYANSPPRTLSKKRGFPAHRSHRTTALPQQIRAQLAGPLIYLLLVVLMDLSASLPRVRRCPECVTALGALLS